MTISALLAGLGEAAPSTASFAATRDNTSGMLMVNFSLSGTATAGQGQDYQVTPQYILFAPGVATVNINVAPNDDSTSEPTETIVEPELFDSAQLEASIGKSLADFTADAEALGASVRVTVIDGVDQPATADYVTSRVNVAVTGEGDDAVVTAIVNVG